MQQSTVLSLLEQIRNPETDMFTQAEAMYTLCAKHGYTQSSLAEQIGVSQSCIGNKTRLLQFLPTERSAIRRHRLTERHARALLRAKPPKREKLIETAAAMRLTVQQTEELVEKYASADLVLSADTQTLSADSFVAQTQAAAQRLCSLGYRTTCMAESGEHWRRITITIIE